MSESTIEQWKSNTRSTVSVALVERLDHEPRRVVWLPGRVAEITTRNRKLSQGRVVSPKDDPFTNGLLVLLDAPEEVRQELGENPNALSEEDMRGLYKLNDKTIKNRLKKIDGIGVLRALQDRAEEFGARASSVRLVEERMEELNPTPEIVAVPEVDPIFGTDTTGIGAPVRVSS